MKQILEMFGEPITYGGQESVVYNMLSSLYADKNFEHSIDLFTPYYSDNKYLIDLIDKHNGKIYALGLDFKTNDIRYFLYSHVLDFFKQGKKYDIVHIHTGSLSTMLVYAMAAKNSGVKKVTVHSHINIMGVGVIGQLRKLIICSLLKKYADVFIGCSEEALNGKFTKDIVEKGIVINNGIDVDKYRFNEKIRNELKKDDRFIVGSLGRIEYQKNNFFMLEVMKELAKEDNNVVMYIVGDGSELHKVKAKTVEYGLVNNIIFVGGVDEPYKYYQVFDVFIMPSRFESFGITAIEAQISGLPTLLSDKIPKATKISSGAEFLPINDPLLWAEKILEIKNKHYKRDSFTIDFDKFDRNKTYSKVKEIYDKF